MKIIERITKQPSLKMKALCPPGSPIPHHSHRAIGRFVYTWGWQSLLGEIREFTNTKAATMDGHLLEIYPHLPVRTRLSILTTSPLFVLVGEKHKGPLTGSQIPMRGCQEEPWRRKRKSKLPGAIVFICTEGRLAHSYHRAAGMFLYDTQRMMGQVSEA